jgi:hypothetical protein
LLETPRNLKKPAPSTVTAAKPGDCQGIVK